MAARPGVAVLKFDKADAGYFVWQGLMNRFGSDPIFEADNATVVLWTFKDYSLADHQFVQLKTSPQESPQTTLTVLIPRKFVMFVFEGKNFHRVLGFSAGLKKEKSVQSGERVL